MVAGTGRKPHRASNPSRSAQISSGLWLSSVYVRVDLEGQRLPRGQDLEQERQPGPVASRHGRSQLGVRIRGDQVPQ
jgi:hypothetical protein